MSTRLRRVLVIAYFFPPLGGAGVQRVLKFVRYLPEFGWRPIVVTTSASWYGVHDESLAHEVPSGTPIVRAGELPVARLRRRLLNPLNRLGAASAITYLGWPDETCGWFPHAVAVAARAARRHDVDVVLSSSYPYTAHLVALAVSRLTRMPWVADFRDEWTCNPQGDPLPEPLQRLNARAERAIVERADRLTVADAHYRLLGLDEHDPRRHVVLNGADPHDIPRAGVAQRSERFRLTYVGTLYGDRDARPVFDACKRLIERGVIDPERFSIVIVGNVWVKPDRVMSALPLELTGYVDHATAVAAMRNATALFHYAPPANRATSGKIYEYLASGRPVLAVARRDSLAFRLVEELGAGHAAEPGDARAIEDAIERLYRAWLDGPLVVPDAVRDRLFARYSRKTLTGELATVLEGASNGRLAPRPAEPARTAFVDAADPAAAD